MATYKIEQDGDWWWILVEFHSEWKRIASHRTRAKAEKHVDRLLRDDKTFASHQ